MTVETKKNSARGRHPRGHAYDTHRGIPAGDESHAVSLGLVDRHLHAVRSNIQTDAKVAINERGGLAFGHDLDRSVGQEYALVHPIAVDGFEPSETMRVYPALVGLDENFGADLGAVGGDAVGEEDLLHESLHVVEVDDGEDLIVRRRGGRRGRRRRRRRVEFDAEDGPADGEYHVRRIGSLGIAVLSQLGRERLAYGVVEVASGIIADDPQEVVTCHLVPPRRAFAHERRRVGGGGSAKEAYTA